MDVILKEDIAKLVLGYLRDENLNDAYCTFCKTSPHLKETYRHLKQGYKAINASFNLETLLKEYFEIKATINYFFASHSFDEEITSQFQNNVRKKLDFIIALALEVSCANGIELKSNKRKRSFSSSSSESINDEISKTSNKKQKQNLHYTILDITDSVFEPENLEHTNKINDFQSHTNTIDLSETLIEHGQFVDNLVININKGLHKSNNKSTETENVNSEHFSQSTEQSLQSQLDECMQNIIGSTLSDPTFDEVLDDVVQQKHASQNDEKLVLIYNETNNTRYEVNNVVSCSTKNSSTPIIPKPCQDNLIDTVQNVDNVNTMMIKSQINEQVNNEKVPVKTNEVSENMSNLLIPSTSSGLQTTQKSNLIQIMSNETINLESVSPENIIFSNELIQYGKANALFLHSENQYKILKIPSSNFNVPFLMTPTVNFPQHIPIVANTTQIQPLTQIQIQPKTQSSITEANVTLNTPEPINSKMPRTRARKKNLTKSMSSKAENDSSVTQRSDSVNNNDNIIETSSGPPENVLQTNTKTTSTLLVLPTLPIIEIPDSPNETSKKIVEKGETPPQNKDHVNFLKIKSNSTPRRRSHIRVLDFNTPGKGFFRGNFSKTPKSVDKCHYYNASKDLKASGSGDIMDDQSSSVSNVNEGITTPFKISDCWDREHGLKTVIGSRKKTETLDTPRVKKSVDICKKVLSRSENDENRISGNKIDDATNDPDIAMEKWKELRSVESTHWDQYIRQTQPVVPRKSRPRKSRAKVDSPIKNVITKKVVKSNQSKKDEKISKKENKIQITDDKKITKKEDKPEETENTNVTIAETNPMTGDKNASIDASEENTKLSKESTNNAKEDSGTLKEDEIKEDNLINMKDSLPLPPLKKKDTITTNKSNVERKSPKRIKLISPKFMKVSPRSRVQNRGKILFSPNKKKQKLKTKSNVSPLQLEPNTILKENKCITPIEQDEKQLSDVIKIDTAPALTKETGFDSNNDLQANDIILIPKPFHNGPITNMATLLETPFKGESSLGYSGFTQPLPVEDTPLTKILRSLTKQNIGHSDIKTPSFAITPGGNSTPSKGFEILTPNSGNYSRPTDYSSSSSYYRPDESGDVYDSSNAVVRKFRTESETEMKTSFLAVEKNVEDPSIISTSLKTIEKDNQNQEMITTKAVDGIGNNQMNVSSSSSSSSTSNYSSSSSASSMNESNDNDNKITNKSHDKSRSNEENIPVQNKTSNLTNKPADKQPSTTSRYPIRTGKIPKKLEPFVVDEKKARDQQELEKKRLRVQEKINKTEVIQKKTVNTRKLLMKEIIAKRNNVPTNEINSKLSVSNSFKSKKLRKNPSPVKFITKQNKHYAQSEMIIKENSKKFNVSDDNDASELISILQDKKDGDSPKKFSKTNDSSDISCIPKTVEKNRFSKEKETVATNESPDLSHKMRTRSSSRNEKVTPVKDFDQKSESISETKKVYNEEQLLENLAQSKIQITLTSTPISQVADVTEFKKTIEKDDNSVIDSSEDDYDDDDDDFEIESIDTVINIEYNEKTDVSAPIQCEPFDPEKNILNVHLDSKIIVLKVHPTVNLYESKPISCKADKIKRPRTAENSSSKDNKHSRSSAAQNSRTKSHQTSLENKTIPKVIQLNVRDDKKRSHTPEKNRSHITTETTKSKQSKSTEDKTHVKKETIEKQFKSENIDIVSNMCSSVPIFNIKHSSKSMERVDAKHESHQKSSSSSKLKNSTEAQQKIVNAGGVNSILEMLHGDQK